MPETLDRIHPEFRKMVEAYTKENQLPLDTILWEEMSNTELLLVAFNGKWQCGMRLQFKNKIYEISHVIRTLKRTGLIINYIFAIQETILSSEFSAPLSISVISKLKINLCEIDFASRLIKASSNTDQ